MEPQQPPAGAGPLREPGPGSERSVGRAIVGFKIPWWVGAVAVVVVAIWLLVVGSGSRGVDHDLRDVLDGATAVELTVVTTDKMIDRRDIDIRESELRLEGVLRGLGAKKADVRLSRPGD